MFLIGPLLKTTKAFVAFACLLILTVLSVAVLGAPNPWVGTLLAILPLIGATVAGLFLMGIFRRVPVKRSLASLEEETLVDVQEFRFTRAISLGRYLQRYPCFLLESEENATVCFAGRYLDEPGTSFPNTRIRVKRRRLSQEFLEMESLGNSLKPVAEFEVTKIDFKRDHLFSDGEIITRPSFDEILLLGACLPAGAAHHD